jgi:hypothetical protein
MITKTSKILVIGSGGREHALAWKFAQTHDWDNVFTLPGNGGIPNSFDINPRDFEAVERFCKEKGVALIFVGPEQPLATGIVDYFRKKQIFKFSDLLKKLPNWKPPRFSPSISCINTKFPQRDLKPFKMQPMPKFTPQKWTVFAF